MKGGLVTDRLLGYSESYFAFLHKLSGASLIRVMTLVTPCVEERHARAAVARLRRRHPMLDTRIVETATGLAFRRDRYMTDDPVEVRRWEGDVDPDAVFAESDFLQFRDEDLPYRFVFLLDPEGGKSAVIAAFHHAISDGSAGYAHQQELVRLIAEETRGARSEDEAHYDMPPSLEEQLVGRSKVGRFLAFALKALTTELINPPPPHEKRGRARPDQSDPCTRMIVLALSREQSDALRARAAEAKLAASDLMIAAFMLAEARLLRSWGGRARRRRLMLSTPLDYRHLLPPPFRRRKDVIALKVFSNFAYHAVEEDADLLDLARRIKGRLTSPGYLDPKQTMFRWFPRSILHATLKRRIEKVRGFCHGIAATHTGRHRGLDCPPLRLVGTFGNICVRDGNLLASMISLLHDGRLVIAFSYAPPFLTQASADNLVDHFVQELQLDGDVLRAEGYYRLARQMGLV